jgi:tetratricopeptide (TPR) repeat protein
MSLFENNSKRNQVEVSGLLNTILNDVVIHNHGVPLDRFKEILTELILTKQDYESQKNTVKNWILKYEELRQRISVDSDDELEKLAKAELDKGNLQKAEDLYQKLYEKNEDDIKYITELLEKKNKYQIKNIINLVIVKELQLKFGETLPLLLGALKYSASNPYLYEKLGANSFELGDFKAAVEYFMKASDLNKALKNFERTIKINLLVVNALRMKGDLIQASQRINATISIGEYFYDQDSLDFANLYDMSATLLQDMGKYFDAEQMNNKAEIIYDRISKKEDLSKNLNYAIFLNNYGQSYRYLGNFEKALVYLQESIKIKKNILNDFHPSIATTLDNIANVYWYINDFDQSITTHEQAIKIRERILPSTHLNLGYSYDNIALSYRGKKDYKKALSYQIKALQIIETAVGENHHELGISYNNLGTTYFHLEDYEKALMHYNKALKVRIKNFGKMSPRVGNTYGCLGWVFAKLEDYDKAIEMMETAIEIFNITLPKDNHEFIIITKGLAEFKIKKRTTT